MFTNRENSSLGLENLSRDVMEESAKSTLQRKLKKESLNRTNILQFNHNECNIMGIYCFIFDFTLELVLVWGHLVSLSGCESFYAEVQD